MSRTYIGPFGRILPVLDDDEDSSDTEQEPATSTESSDMATYQLPPPPTMPTVLNFGSDPRPGFSEPNKYGVSSFSRKIDPPRQSFDEPRREYPTQHGQLPSVSQLLTPGSQPSLPPSPYSPRQSPLPLENRPSQPSPVRSSASDKPLQAGEVPYPSGYAQLPVQNPFPVSTESRREGAPSGPLALQYPAFYPQSHDVPNQYPDYSGAVPQPPYPLQPQPIPAPVSHPGQYNQVPVTPYGGYNPMPLSIPTQTRQDPVQTIKPVPRVVGSQDVPGEGSCWVYEDGSICRKVIDGEPVNAQWGVTKAGKPRKRLAIACTTCREKKIKCDPGEGKCLQCDKFGRECRFTTA
ncbi:MAG: hypothetical protein LQ342_002720 [Letrouitia transgressa]|nr:MAG: hypothetical protein LQ342_002720 [Letrouitia transgressa]